jgi:membrane protease YdiL (CAAX protease family)
MTTSPHEIGGSTAPTRTAARDEALAAHPATILAEWARYRRFLARPRLPASGAQWPGAWRAMLRLLALDMVVMGVFIAGLSFASVLGFEPPANVNTTLKPGLAAIALVVLLAPLGEELVFRSWLSGRPAIIALVALAVLGLGILLPAGMMIEATTPRLALSMLGLVVGLIVAPLVAVFFDRPVPRLFETLFPLLFWASTLGFALVHLGNYTEGSLAILLPLVLPQFALGTMLGYLRVHHGLLPAIALHASHNAILFGLAILGGLGGEGAGLAF